MTVPQAINAIIKENGINILNSPEKLRSMVMDYVNGYEREKRLFCRLCQIGILSYAHEMISLRDEISIKDVATKAKVRLEQDYFMVEEYALLGINMVLEGLGMNYKIEKENIDENETQENKSHKLDSMEMKTQHEYKVILTHDYRIKIDENIIQDLRKAAQDGNENALISLGDCYAHGIIVDKLDLNLAEYYYRKAKELGNKEATYKLIKLFNLQQK